VSERAKSHAHQELNFVVRDNKILLTMQNSALGTRNQPNCVSNLRQGHKILSGNSVRDRKGPERFRERV
jgi:hypothetical protein